MRHVRHVALTASAFALGAAALQPVARADDTVDLQVAGNAAVAGTIRPASERELFRLALGTGTKVLAVAKAKAKRGAFVPQIDLTDPSSMAVATGTLKGRGSKLSSAPVVTGGTHALRVFGDGSADGDYTLAITVKPQKSFSGSGSTVAEVQQLAYTFGAPAGAKARIVLKAGAGKTFVPVLDSLDGPSGAHVELSGASTAPIALGASGDWTVRFHDGGSAGGAWVCQVILTLPKLRRAKIDISAAALTGGFADQQPIYGRLVDDEGGLLDPPDTGGSLDGASISIPVGGMPYPVVITMGPAPPVGGLGGNHPAGPAIQFGPAGLVFQDGKPATITLPYDATRFTDVENELTLFVKDDTTGVVSQVPKPYTFSAPGIVSFPAPHFSTYMAAAPSPRPIDGSWVVASLEAETTVNFGADVRATAGTIDFLGQNFYIGLNGRSASWTKLNPEIGGPSAGIGYAYDSDSGSYTDFGGTTSLSPSGGGADTLLHAPGGDVMLRVPDDGSNATFAIALREAVGQPTFVNIAGRWTLMVVERSAEFVGGGQPPDIRISTELTVGTAVFREDGTVSVSVPSTSRSESAFPTGSWRTDRKAFNASGVCDNSDGFFVRFSGEGPTGTELGDAMQLRACLDGEVLIAARDSGTEVPALFIFVREGSRRAPLVGKSTFVFTSSDVVNASGTSDAQRLTYRAGRGLAEFTAAGRVTFDRAGTLEFGHDASGQPTASPFSALSEDGTYSVAPSGVYRDATGFRGALSTSGRFLLGARTVGSRQEIFAALPGVDLTPR